MFIHIYIYIYIHIYIYCIYIIYKWPCTPRWASRRSTCATPSSRAPSRNAGQVRPTAYGSRQGQNLALTF